MECNSLQIPKDFKFSKYKGHPTRKINTPPHHSHPSISLYYKKGPTTSHHSEAGVDYVHVQNTSWGPHHAHSYASFIDLPLPLGKKRVETRYRTTRSPTRHPTLQPETQLVNPDLLGCRQGGCHQGTLQRKGDSGHWWVLRASPFSSNSGVIAP